MKGLLVSSVMYMALMRGERDSFFGCGMGGKGALFFIDHHPWVQKGSPHTHTHHIPPSSPPYHRSSSSTHAHTVYPSTWLCTSQDHPGDGVVPPLSASTTHLFFFALLYSMCVCVCAVCNFFFSTHTVHDSAQLFFLSLPHIHPLWTKGKEEQRVGRI